MDFGATLAEPALNAMGVTVQNLTDGALNKRTLVYSVAAGVGLGVLSGVLKIVLNLPLAWDSAGVTTGPVTVPLVLAMGLGLGKAVDAVEGFGVLAMASVGPIVSVLAVSLRAQARERIYQFDTARPENG